MILRKPSELRNKAQNAIKNYFNSERTPKQFVGNIYTIRMINGLTAEIFDQELTKFEGHHKIKGIREAIEEYDVFGDFKGTMAPK